MPATLSDPHVQRLAEHIQDWNTGEVIVDRSQRTVRGIALTGLQSKNGYRYSERALRDAIPLYDGKPVFLDHARNLSRPYERSTRDLVGTVVNPRFENGRVRSDIQVLDTDSGRTFLALADAKSPTVGMSHVVLAERSSDGSIVEKIHEVVSIDAVVFPATTSTFREQTGAAGPASIPGSMESILESIDAQLPDHIHRLAGSDSADIRRVALFPGRVLVEFIRRESDGPETRFLDWSISENGVSLGETLSERDSISDSRWTDAAFATGTGASETESAQHSTVIAERDEALAAIGKLKTRLADFETERERSEREREVDRLIAESALPAFAVTDLLERQLLDAPDTKTRRALIAERLSILKEIRVREPHSLERTDTDSAASPDDEFVTAIRSERFPALAGTG